MTFQTIELFRMEELFEDIEQKIAMAQQAIKALFSQGRVVVLAYSGGRDSSTVASLTLNAAREFAEAGGKPVVLVTTSDTLVESPEIVANYRREHARMKTYANKHGIVMNAHIVTPTLASTFQMKILTGRGLPSFPGTSSDCSTDLKITPQQSFRNRFFRAMKEQGDPEPVTLIGTRFSESERRAANMRARGERALEPARNKDGELVMSPICWWSEEDVMEYLALAKNAQFEAFSHFSETLDLYAHAAGTSCSIVAMAIEEGGQKKRVGKCGSRHGCFTCQQAEDKSLENMIEFDKRYEYARGLNKLNKFIRATRYDWNRRNWVGRTIKAGFIAIEPDTYHPKMIRELTRYMLQLDHDEYIRSMNAEEPKKFDLLPLEMMIAIDAVQSLNGVSAPFAMWADYRDITSGQVRYDIPDLPTVPESSMPETKFLYVGEEWDTTSDSIYTGMRDPLYEAMTEGLPCAPELKTLDNGRTVWNVATEQSFSVDSESAAMIAEFEIDRLADMYDSGMMRCITAGYRWYLSYGCLNLSHSQKAEHDLFLSRTAFKHRMGLTLNYDIEELRNRAIPYSQLPPEARAAWKKKATTSSAQIDLFAIAA